MRRDTATKPHEKRMPDLEGGRSWLVSALKLCGHFLAKRGMPKAIGPDTLSKAVVGIMLTGCLTGPWVRGAEDEIRAFNSAAKAFQDGLAERAEREAADFVQKYPTSPRLPDAILLQARGAFSPSKPQRAISVLSTNLGRAGQAADQYRFWLGQFRLESGDYNGAASDFGQLLKDYPTSPRRLEGAYGEARARFRLEDWARTAELLRKPDGAFQQAARAAPGSEWVSKGQILLAEALFKLQDFPAAEAAAAQTPAAPTEIGWLRQLLICRIQSASGRSQAALAGTTNLIKLASASGQAVLVAESYALQGAILEQLRQFDAATATYEKLQAEKMPEAQRHDAFLRIIELSLTQNNLAAATIRLEKFLAANPQDSASDEVLITLGELRLKEHMLGLALSNAPATNGVAAPPTNKLQQALGHFDQFIQKFPRSPYIGKAYLGRAWALLADGKVLEGQAAFKLAADKTPPSEDQAIARFKLADTQFLQSDFTNALAGYRKIIEDYGGLPRVRTGLFDRAWYQIARLCIKTGDLPGADDAMRKILMLYPASLYSERILLLFGQELNQANRPAEARALFADFARQFTNSTLLPEVLLAMGRSQELEAKWTNAIQIYQDLLVRFPTNPVAPRTQFRLALAQDHAGRSSNALSLMTNLVVRYANHEDAPRAQDWIGDFYFRNEDFAEAERNYQRLYQNTNWAGGEIAFQAKFKAGRAAVMRQSYDDAISYFLGLINDKQCPGPLVAETFFAYGDTLIMRPQNAEATNTLARFETALETFRKIPQLYPTSPLVPRAQGRIADCYLQLATQHPQRYTNAIEYYEKAMSPAGDVATRSQAETGLGHTLSRQAQLTSPPDAQALQSALDHYLNVVYGKNLEDDEKPVPIWIKESGLAAAQILESQKKWSQAILLYSRLQQMLPPLRPSLERKIALAREQAAGKKE